jgi:hypothetical protein
MRFSGFSPFTMPVQVKQVQKNKFSGEAANHSGSLTGKMLKIDSAWIPALARATGLPESQFQNNGNHQVEIVSDDQSSSERQVEFKTQEGTRHTVPARYFHAPGHRGYR